MVGKELGMKTTHTECTNHVVIIGWDQFVRFLAHQLIHAEKEVVAVTDKVSNIESMNRIFDTPYFVPIYEDLRNYDEVIKATNMNNAGVVLLNLADDTDKLVYVINLKKHLKASMKFIVPLDRSNLKDTFKNAGVTYPLSKDEIVSKMVASYLFETDVALYNEDLLATAKHETDHDIKQFRVTKDNPFFQKTYIDAFKDLKKKYNSILLGMAKKDLSSGSSKLLKNPPDNTQIQENDYLIMIVNGNSLRKVKEVFNVKEGSI